MLKDEGYIAQLRVDKTRITQIGKSAYELELDEKVQAFENKPPVQDFADGVCYLRFGESYARVGAYQKAVNFGIKALDIFTALERSEKTYAEMLRACSDISGAYHSLQETKKAWEFSLRRSFLLLEQFPDPYAPEREYVIEGLANLYEAMEDYEQAITWSYTGLDFEQKVHGGRILCLTKWHERLARLYRQLGDIQKETDHLWKITELIQKLNEKLTYKDAYDPTLYDAWKRLLEIFEGQGTPEKADCFREEFIEMSYFADDQHEW